MGRTPVTAFIGQIADHYHQMMQWLAPYGAMLLALVKPLGLLIEDMLRPYTPVIAKVIYYDGFRIFSAFMYVCFCVGLWILGFKYQQAVVRKDENIGQFPKAYFFWLTVSLVPITITGFVERDTYIIVTRLMTFVSILGVHGLVSSADGTFNTWRYRFWVGFWLAFFGIGAMVWTHSVLLQTFVTEFEKPIAWSSVVLMIVFMVRGQLSVARELFRHYLIGSESVKRFTLQIFRFFSFLPQALHYFLAPMAIGGAIAWNNAIAWQGLIGWLGVVWVLINSVVGFVRGHDRRRELRRERRANWQITGTRQEAA